MTDPYAESDVWPDPLPRTDAARPAESGARLARYAEAIERAIHDALDDAWSNGRVELDEDGEPSMLDIAGIAAEAVLSLIDGGADAPGTSDAVASVSVENATSAPPSPPADAELAEARAEVERLQRHHTAMTVHDMKQLKAAWRERDEALATARENFVSHLKDVDDKQALAEWERLLDRMTVSRDQWRARDAEALEQLSRLREAVERLAGEWQAEASRDRDRIEAETVATALVRLSTRVGVLERASHNARAVLAGVAEQEAGEATVDLNEANDSPGWRDYRNWIAAGRPKDWKPGTLPAPSGSDDTKGGE